MCLPNPAFHYESKLKLCGIALSSTIVTVRRLT
jgi:hypothetical protein